MRTCAIILALVACLPGRGMAQPPKDPPAAEKVPMADLDKLFQRMDWDAVDAAKAEGEKAIPRIEPYLKDAEAHRRTLAVDCLGAIGGAKAQELLVRALSDQYEQVRANAVAALHENPPVGREKELGRAFDRTTKDNFIRQQIPMILGRIGTPEALGEIANRANTDLHPEVQDGIISGRAKAGDQPGREQFAGLMRAAEGRRIGELMAFVKYENDAWILPLLNLWINRTEVSQVISTHVKHIERRACDLAVDETLRLNSGKREFQVKPRPAEQYKPTELGEIREYLASLGKSPYLKDQ